MPYQNLQVFKMPPGFRGKSGWYVQLWWIVEAVLFRPSPQVMYGWRRWLLRIFGSKIGKKAIIRPSVRITYPWKVTIGDNSWIGDHTELYSLGNIIIGKNVVISQKSYLCTGSHQYESLSFDIFEKPIIIEDEVWVATDVFVGPGVTIGEGSVIGARSTVLKSLEGGFIYAGSPLQKIRRRKG